MQGGRVSLSNSAGSSTIQRESPLFSLPTTSSSDGCGKRGSHWLRPASFSSSRWASRWGSQQRASATSRFCSSRQQAVIDDEPGR
nr:hypothetical protein Itr_chr15CG10120 [Ipomoea trifida]